MEKRLTDKYQILTSKGFSDFDGIACMGEDYTHNVLLMDGTQIRANSRHTFVVDGQELVCSELKPGMSLERNGKLVKVFNVQRNFAHEKVYDILEVKGHHTYLANGVNVHNCKFIGSSATLVNADVLEKMKYENPIRFDMNDKLSVYEDPLPYFSGRSIENDIPKSLDDFERFSHLPMADYEKLLKAYTENIGKRREAAPKTYMGKFVYVLGVDTAKGVGKDYSVVQVIKVYVDESNNLRYQQVATYRNNYCQPVPDFLEDVLYIAKRYNNAVLMIENNDVGGNVATMLHYKYGYENIVSLHKKEIGIRSNNKLKVEACLHLKDIIDNGYLRVINKETVNELGHFEEVKTNVFKAIEGRNDDMVMALVWAVFITKTEEFESFGFDLRSINTHESKYSEEELYDDSVDYAPLVMF